MRLAIGLTASLALAGAAQAQPRGYYPDPWSAAYAYAYEPPTAYGPDGRYTPYVWPNGYDGYHYSAEVREHDRADNASAAASALVDTDRRPRSSLRANRSTDERKRPSVAGEPSP